MTASSTLANLNRPLHVLGIGETSPGDEDLAVREVARAASRGARVLAVTSLPQGVRERLQERARSRFPELSPDVLAFLLAAEETASAALLSLALEAKGVENEVLDPHRMNLLARGPALDAEPSDIDTEEIEKALAARPVAVLPGGFGRRSSGRIALVGAGGDLTALFLAERLGAQECRLVKRDLGSYRRASWEELLAAGGSGVERRAVEFARRHRLSFTIGAPLSDAPTRVGPVTELAG